MAAHRPTPLAVASLTPRDDRDSLTTTTVVPPLAVLSALVDEALRAIERALEPLLLDDDRGGNRDAPPPYVDGAPSLHAWAPGARVRLGELSLVLETVRADVEQLAQVGTSRGHERLSRSIASTLEHHEAVEAVVDSWLALAKTTLAQQRGDPVDPSIHWERAWLARDATVQRAHKPSSR
jgi:hypothetical protein